MIETGGDGKKWVEREAGSRTVKKRVGRRERDTGWRDEMNTGDGRRRRRRQR